ncbi:MAG TPA: DUF4430 domain-containing protein [Dehalococcoidia bacterium]|nr:DUF4430 domain-containing protein [Dehalococcoidia bacterium]
MKARIFFTVLLLPALWAGVACSDDGGSGAAGSSASTAAVETQAVVRGTVVVDFTGAPQERPKVSMAFQVPAGEKAWTAIKQALGESNVSFRDFGGDLGVFITGFYGVTAQGNDYWQFIVNGKSSDVGVSGYTVQNGDVLEFKYTRS